MHKFLEAFKEKARNKEISARDMIALCIFRAMKSKSENKEEALKYFLRKAFTPGNIAPHRQYPYQTISNLMYWGWTTSPTRRWNGSEYITQPGTLFEIPITELFNDDEYAEFNEMKNLIKPDFVRSL